MRQHFCRINFLAKILSPIVFESHIFNTNTGTKIIYHHQHISDYTMARLYIEAWLSVSLMSGRVDLQERFRFPHRGLLLRIRVHGHGDGAYWRICHDRLILKLQERISFEKIKLAYLTGEIPGRHLFLFFLFSCSFRLLPPFVCFSFVFISIFLFHVYFLYFFTSYFCWGCCGLS